MKFISICQGDIILHPIGGVIAPVLGWFLWLFNRWWDRKLWHMSIAWRCLYTGIEVMESQASGVKFSFYSWDKLKGHAIYHIKEAVDYKVMDKFAREHLGCPYDADAYIGTALSILMRYYLRVHFRIVDKSYYCWELAEEWLREIGECPVPPYQYLLITDLAREAEEF